MNQMRRRLLALATGCLVLMLVTTPASAKLFVGTDEADIFQGTPQPTRCAVRAALTPHTGGRARPDLWPSG